MEKKIFLIAVAMVMHFLTFAQTQDDLFSACLKCDLDGVKKAIEKGVNVNTPHATTKQNALAYAYFCPDVTAYLLEKGCDPNGGSYPALLGAANVGSYDVMKMLLEKGADPNKSVYNVTALTTIARMTNCAECAGLLLSKGAGKDSKESVYGNALGVYASNGLSQSDRKAAMIKFGEVLKGYGLLVPEWYYNPSSVLNATPDEMVKALVKHGVDINLPSTTGEPPLFTAMNVGKQDVILAFLKNGADYNASHNVIEKGVLMWDVKGGYTPLMYACVKGYHDVAKWLVSQPELLNSTVSGTSITESKMIIQINGLSAIYLAINSHDFEMVKLLTDLSGKWDDLEIKALPGQKFAGNYGSKDKMFNFVVSKKGSLKYTPSMFAELLKQTEIAKYLSSKGL